MPERTDPDPYVVADRDALRRIYKMPGDGAVKKVLGALDRHASAFIARSPFCVLATADAHGNLDASPKGGPPGFVKVADDRTVMLPDWPGNNRLDGLENILANPHVGVLFFLPGMNEMLRLNGRARITVDPIVKRRFETDGKLPLSVIIVAVDQVYLHCARALQRAALWDSARHVDRAREFPSMGRMLADQIAGYDAAATDQLIERHKNDLY
jgi:PPOX class probable FMN-dependent enzyme